MLNKLLPILFLFFLSIHQVKAQSSTISVGPLLACSAITFSCPSVSGCCTIGGCCGSGCCENGYTCINEGTLEQACCPAFDSTKCGTVTPTSDSGSGSGSGDHTCTAIHNCRDVSGSTWTCLLGMTCGFSYRICNPCPYIGSGSGSSSSSSSGSNPSSSSSPSSISSSSESTPSSSSSSSGGDSSSESRPSSSSTSSGGSSSSRSSPSPSSSSSKSSGYRSREGTLRVHWLAAVGVGGVIAIAV